MRPVVLRRPVPARAAPRAALPFAIRCSAWAAAALLLACDTSQKAPEGLVAPGSSLPAKKAVGGDTPTPPPAPSQRELQLLSHCGGTHHRTLVHAGHWFQTFSNQLLVLDPRTGAVEGRQELAPFGTTGAAVDVALLGAGTPSPRLFVVLERDAVVEVDLVDPTHPAIVSLRRADELGVRPRRVGIVDGQVYVAGDGGVVRWSDRARFLADNIPGPAGAVVGGERCPVTCVGRRVLSLVDGSFIGAATDLTELPPGAPAPLAFVLQGKDAATVGLMGRDIREVSSVVIPGTVRRMRWFDDRLWVVTDTEIVSCAVAETRLADRRSFRVKGARDVDLLSQNTLAVAGTFGRSLYRRVEEDGKPGDAFFGAHREASRLERAITDNRRVLAGSDEGTWMYLIGDRAELSNRTIDIARQPSAHAAGAWGTAEIGEDGRSVTGVVDGIPQEFRPDGSPQIWCIAGIDKALWIGHENGITVVSRGASGLITALGTIHLDGPVRYLFPKWDSGCTYVAELGGFGVAKLVDRSVPTTEGDAKGGN
ncbi:MAG: hypothetical protein U0575_12115 [Phycisphaerales bacterium]